VGDFNLLDNFWKYNTAERKQCKRFLECVEDNFLTQLVSEPTRGGVSLHLLFTNRGLVGDVVFGGHLGLSNHEMIEFLVCGEVKRGESKITILDFQRADFGLFRMLVERVPWENSPEGQRGSGRLDILQEGSLKGTGAGCPHVSQDELAGKTIGLAEQGDLAGTQEKKESLPLTKEREGNSRVVQGVS